jgi:hypothetical protein
MNSKEAFKDSILNGYNLKGESIILGGAMLDGETISDTFVKIPLKTLNRHGLIAGATGTGKTKTIQVLSEQLSLHGIPVLMMDIKGDFSGIAAPGEALPFIQDRHQKINLSYSTAAFPVELLTLSAQNGVRLRATVSEFRPVLFSRILYFNETQSVVVFIIFKYCDDKQLPLLDLTHITKVINYITEEGKKKFQKTP